MRASRRIVSLLAATIVVGLLAPAATPAAPPLSALWEEPNDLAARDLYLGPWGQEHAPDPGAVYTFLRPKQGGVNPGLIVRDPLGREWHVKQSAPDNTHGAEGPVEVVLSRILSAVGYHQPPVYFLSSFMLARHGSSGKPERGGRFRLSDPDLKAHGSWKWMDNPFAETRQLRGLLAILLIFNSSDLKDSNNTLYDVRQGGAVTQWFVVRDLGTALGETGRLAPMRSDPALLGKQPFIAGVRDGYVRFHYHGLHQELFDRHLTVDDVEWAGALLSRLSDKQWRDAFRAGGYTPVATEQFVTVVRARVAEAANIRGAVTTTTRSRP
jgi:hypothetical protein